MRERNNENGILGIPRAAATGHCKFTGGLLSRIKVAESQSLPSIFTFNKE